MDEVKIGFATRFQEMLDHHHDSINDLAKKLGKANASLYGLVDKKAKHMPSSRVLLEVLEIYPKVSYKWLLKGTGLMLAEDKIIKVKPTDDLMEFTMIIENVDRLISQGNQKKWKSLRGGLIGSFTLQQNKMYKKGEEEKALNDKLVNMYERMIDLSDQVKGAME